SACRRLNGSRPYARIGDGRLRMAAAYLEDFMRRIVLSVLLSAALCAAARAGEAVATGFVFEDRNENGVRDAGERGLPDVCVSNGEDVVKTDASGRYELPVSDDCVIFVIKPRDWATAVDELNLPKFWYVHKPAGSPAHLKYPGVLPT